MKSTQTVRVMRDGQVVREETLEGVAPEMRAGDPSGLVDLNRVASAKAGFLYLLRVN